MSQAFLCDGCDLFYGYEPDLVVTAKSIFFSDPVLASGELHLCAQCSKEFLDWLENHKNVSRSEAQNEREPF